MNIYYIYRMYTMCTMYTLYIYVSMCDICANDLQLLSCWSYHKFAAQISYAKSTTTTTGKGAGNVSAMHVCVRWCVCGTCRTHSAAVFNIIAICIIAKL